MTAQYIYCDQGSPEWFSARLGIPTASEFGTVMAKGRNGGDSKTRRTYMLRLIGERMTGEIAESYSNPHMERGKAMEDEARRLYCFMRDADTVPIGFIRSGDKGASPDSLVTESGLLEIKTKLPHLQLDALLSGDLPAEHKPQVQGQLWVAEREWCDFVSYWPKLPPLIVRVFRDDAYIRTIAAAVDDFLSELHELQTTIQQRYA